MRNWWLLRVKFEYEFNVCLTWKPAKWMAFRSAICARWRDHVATRLYKFVKPKIPALPLLLSPLHLRLLHLCRRLCLLYRFAWYLTTIVFSMTNAIPFIAIWPKVTSNGPFYRLTRDTASQREEKREEEKTVAVSSFNCKVNQLNQMWRLRVVSFGQNICVFKVPNEQKTRIKSETFLPLRFEREKKLFDLSTTVN